MDLASLVHRFDNALKRKYGERLLPSHHRALEAIVRCRTADAGELLLGCNPCDERHWYPRSCGHRSCPRCQNHEASVWLQRQRAKLLPVDYFMVTFTLPAQLRALAWANQRAVYDILFKAATDTLMSFALNPRQLGAALGMTAVLHTHSRRLDFHPHLHVVVPGGGVDLDRQCWKRTRYRYLFNEFALAKVFRAKCLSEFERVALALPRGVPDQWVVDCAHVGRGAEALEYLSRYLYRGVVAERNLFEASDGQIGFRYTDSSTGQLCTRTLPGEDFLWLLVQHVLPRRFHRARDYGFLHHNARKCLQLVQYILRVTIPPKPAKQRPAWRCPSCGLPMTVLAIRAAPPFVFTTSHGVDPPPCSAA